MKLPLSSRTPEVCFAQFLQYILWGCGRNSRPPQIAGRGYLPDQGAESRPKDRQGQIVVADTANKQGEQTPNRAKWYRIKLRPQWTDITGNSSQKSFIQPCWDRQSWRKHKKKKERENSSAGRIHTNLRSCSSGGFPVSGGWKRSTVGRERRGGRKGNVERSTTNSSPAVATSVESCRWDMCGKGSGRDV